MKNLAGNEFCDGYIVEELCAANIPVKHLERRADREVDYSCEGFLNGFIFKRCWYYWSVTGYMPMNFAIELYNKHRDLNIRVSGDCGNPPPESYGISKDWEERAQPYFDKFYAKEIELKELNNIVEPMVKEGELFINSYHIDTQEGLNIFARIILENNIQG